jgi:putative flippase GtrA
MHKYKTDKFNSFAKVHIFDDLWLAILVYLSHISHISLSISCMVQIVIGTPCRFIIDTWPVASIKKIT